MREAAKQGILSRGSGFAIPGGFGREPAEKTAPAKTAGRK
jgi:hypothetical protein